MYFGKTGRRLPKRFHEYMYLQDFQKIDKDAFKPVTRHVNFPAHSSQHMKVCDPSLHQGNNMESRKKPYKLRVKIHLSNRHS